MPELPEAIVDNITNFTGRTWLLSPLLTWCHESAERIFLLTGEPGSGKSTVIAWLAGAGPVPVDPSAKLQLEQIRSLVGAVHFCRFASVDSTTPGGFAETIAEQLARNIRGFDARLPEKLRLSIEQHIEKIEPGGSVTGIRIDKLSLNSDISEDTFKYLLLDPLKKLYREGYNKPVILLVDALDEAVSYTGETSIIQLLTQLENLPKQVRIVATTRPDAAVLKNYRKVTYLNLIEDAPIDTDDVRLYISNRLGMLSKLYQRQMPQLADNIVDAAKGNFLFAHLALNDLLLRLATNKVVEMLPLPTKLSEFYYQFLNRKWGRDEESWFETFKPLMGLIAVSQGDGLSREQIDSITGQDSEKALREISQYFRGKFPNGPFRLFHKSFEDFLLDDEENIDYHIDARSMHYLIARYYQKRYHNNWDQLDGYGIVFLMEHIASYINRRIYKRRDDESDNLYSEKTEYFIRYFISHCISAESHDYIGQAVDKLLGNNT